MSCCKNAANIRFMRALSPRQMSPDLHYHHLLSPTLNTTPPVIKSDLNSFPLNSSRFFPPHLLLLSPSALARIGQNYGRQYDIAGGSAIDLNFSPKGVRARCTFYSAAARVRWHGAAAPFLSTNQPGIAGRAARLEREGIGSRCVAGDARVVPTAVRSGLRS